jgi:transcriptional regulator with XRE-family HTH domain
MEVDVQKLKRLREDRVLSQRELAWMAGLTHATVWRLENGFENAHPQTIRKIAGVLGVEPRELVKKGGQNG